MNSNRGVLFVSLLGVAMLFYAAGVQSLWWMAWAGTHFALAIFLHVTDKEYK